MKLSNDGEELRILKKENKDYQVALAGQGHSPAHAASLYPASCCSLLPTNPTVLPWLVLQAHASC